MSNSTAPIESHFSYLQTRILTHLQQQQCMSEYDLIKALQAENAPGFPDESLTQALSLFHMHFLLYHLLYRLQHHLSLKQQGILEIQALQICLYPYAVQHKDTLCLADPVANYYADFRPWHTTTEENVQDKLNYFWTLMATRDDKQRALETLNLTEPVTYPQIKQRYRRLAMQLHPDQGGDTAAMQRLNQAFRILEKYYR